MKENADKYLDSLSRKLAGKDSIESPSLDFTANVMSQIKAYGSSKVTRYKPLISNSVWFVIVLVSMATIAYVYFDTPAYESLWLKTMDLSRLADFNVSQWLPSFDVSQTTFYIVLFSAVMFGIQLPILKHQLHKRFE